MPHRFTGLFLALVGLMALASCGKPAPGSVAARHAQVVAALAAGDGQALYPLLDDRVQGELSALYESVASTVAKIDERYPARQRDAARREAGAALIEGIEGPEALFLRLLGERSPQKLSRLQTLGAVEGRVTQDGDSAQLTTKGGDVWNYRAHPEAGDWRWVPPDPDREFLRAALARARKNAAQVDDQLSRLHRFRQGVIEEMSEGGDTPVPRGKTGP